MRERGAEQDALLEVVAGVPAELAAAVAGQHALAGQIAELRDAAARASESEADELHEALRPPPR